MNPAEGIIIYLERTASRIGKVAFVLFIIAFMNMMWAYELDKRDCKQACGGHTEMRIVGGVWRVFVPFAGRGDVVCECFAPWKEVRRAP